MVSISSFSSILAISLASPRKCCRKNLSVSPSPSQFLFCNFCFFSLKYFSVLNSSCLAFLFLIFTSFFNFYMDSCPIVLQTAWKIGKDGIEAGTSLVPVSPRSSSSMSPFLMMFKIAIWFNFCPTEYEWIPSCSFVRTLFQDQLQESQLLWSL